ncbi:hypothetical protein PROPEN_01150 [Proteus penneri ATCC 35198]|nr:hypothetical protein PROPEN_01150 [Proteus penneri ATCC 35198]
MICALMASFPSFANCLSVTEGNEITGQFDNNTVCFATHLEHERYVELNVKGIQNLRLETQDGTHIRSLLKDVPADGQQKIRFYCLKRLVINWLHKVRRGSHGNSC